MFSATTYIARRAELCRRIGGGLILIPGNAEASYNYPNNTYHFRQDGTFLYYFGLNLPQFFGVIDAATGEATLFGDDVTVDDIMDQSGLPLLGLVPEDENVILAAAFHQPLLGYRKKGAAAACLRIAKRIQGRSVPVKL